MRMIYESLTKKSKTSIKFPSLASIIMDADLILSIPGISVSNSRKIDFVD